MSSPRDWDVNVFESCLKIGCCQRCCLRLMGERNPEIYNNVTQILKNKGIIVEEYINCEDESNKLKVMKGNPCIGCLGLLQKPFAEAVVEKVLTEIEQFSYDSPTFNIALVFPVSMQLRAHSLYLYLQNNYPKHCATLNPQTRAINVGVKDVWKWRHLSQMKDKFTSPKKYDPYSSLTVTVKMKYAAEDKECSALFKMLPNDFSKTKNRKNQGSVDIYSRKSVEKALETVDDNIFKSHYQCPPEIPSEPMICEEVAAFHNSIHIAGRYNKWSRELPQTPWIIDGKRRMESSVQEIITEPLLKLTLAQEARFSSSGREDVDVRTLGRGRPFSVELIDPKKTIFTKEEMRKAEQQVNELGNNKVTIRDLQIVGKECLNLLKTGEEMKTKDYNALCLLLNTDSSESNSKEYSVEDCLQKLNKIQTPLVIDQTTPIRVLHRRALAVRQKTIHTMRGTKISEDQFALYLQTQAGTYIKEFVHGDLGRTRPSLGELLDGYQVDILALDVQDVSLDWPPPIDTSNGNSVHTLNK